jgi:outer membrane protein assembly factor BamB
MNKGSVEMRRSLTFGIVVLLANSMVFAGADWTRFRGPEGTGVSPEKGLPDALDPARNAVWSVKIPLGVSSPVVAGGRVFLTGHEGDERLVLCFDASTGKSLWRRSFRKVRDEAFNKTHGPASPTPVLNRSRLFVFFPDIGLLAFDVAGKELWRQNLGPFGSVQGLASSPVAVDGRIVILADSPAEAYLIAFEADSGKQVWRTERPTGVLGSYSTPAVLPKTTPPSEIIVAGARELTGYRADTGQRLWWGMDLTSYPMASPFVVGDSVYTLEPAGVNWPPFSQPLGLFDADKDGQVTLKEAEKDPSWRGSLLGIDLHAGNGDGVVTAEEYRRGTSGEAGGMYRIRLGAIGDIRPSVVWRHTKGLPELASALHYEGVLYTIRRGVVSAFDPANGNLLRQDRLKDALGDYYASPVAGDGKIYLVSLDGVATVLRSGVDWTVLAANDLGERVSASPAIAGGAIFIRTQGTLHCFRKKDR